jgi:SRSO17 transposase
LSCPLELHGSGPTIVYSLSITRGIPHCCNKIGPQRSCPGHARARDTLQRHLAAAVAAAPADATGTVGVIDETSCRKWGEQTPGVQRQYLGCLGKLDNGIVIVHVGVSKGTFQALLDAELYLPKFWDQDRPRCRAAGIPDEVRYRPKWRIALDQLARLGRNGMRFDWLVFDEGYGAAVPFLEVLGIVGQRFAAEVPVNFSRSVIAPTAPRGGPTSGSPSPRRRAVGVTGRPTGR